MDPTSIIQTITEQGTLFWAAAGSVALGVTLILAAAVGQIRLMRSRSSGWGRGGAGAPAPLDLPEPALESIATEEKYPTPSEAASAPTDVRELRLLLRRVRSAADKMEDFRRKTSSPMPEAAESPLKVAPEGVDYVFRAGIG